MLKSGRLECRVLIVAGWVGCFQATSRYNRSLGWSSSRLTPTYISSEGVCKANSFWAQLRKNKKEIAKNGKAISIIATGDMSSMSGSEVAVLIYEQVHSGNPYYISSEKDYVIYFTIYTYLLSLSLSLFSLLYI